MKTTSTIVYRHIALVTLLLLMVVGASAQSERQHITNGNKQYKSGKYSEAEIAYRKSLEKNKESIPGRYDLGNAYYKQQRFEEAISQYNQLLNDKNLDKSEKATVYHNLGNTFLESKKYEESIEAFKNSLRMNPKDNDTRYNLAYAQSMLQQQQQQQQQQQNNQDKKDKNKPKQDQQKQQQKQQEKKDQKQQEAQKRQNISREDAEKMLQALNNDEKNTQKKLVKKESTRIRIEKQW